MPEDLRERFALPALGTGSGDLKTAILGGNSAALYGFAGAETRPTGERPDRLTSHRQDYLKGGEQRSNAFYGFIHSS